MSNPRKLAVKALLSVESNAAYSNITLNNIFSQEQLTREDRALTTAIFYGVLDRKITLDYIISSFLKTPISKVAPFTLQVLRSALYQIMFMERIPDSAAVNEAVKLIKKSRESRNAGFVNAVLRNALRSERKLPEGDNIKALSIRFSCPEWIVESFIKDYGIKNAKSLLEESLKPAPVIIRVNTLKTTTESLIEELEKQNIPCSKTETENALILTGGFDAANCTLYKKGYFFAEDTASQKAISVLPVKPGDRLLDVCSAPGGKSFMAAQLLQNNGEITACDLYEQRVGLIRDSAKRLGIDIIKPLTQDALEFNENLGLYNCVLCDVPCSGLGVMRRKPEIKYKKVEGLDELAEIQYNIIQNAARYLKCGGNILYSTCTLRKNENENIVRKFLNNNSGYQKKYEHTFMPHIDKTDGFYCALIEKSDS